MTTPIDTKALRDLLAKATPGPWDVRIHQYAIADTVAALLDQIERKDAEIASQRTQWNTLHRIIRDFEIAAARRFGATGSVYDEGRRVAYGQCCAEIRAALAPQPDATLQR